MKSTVLNVVCLVSAVFAIAAVAANGQQPTPPAPEKADAGTSPRIKFDADVYNFGKVAAGEPIQHTFIVSNTGNATLIINNVRPGCGCTTAGVWTREIEPGKTGVIPIQIASGGLRGTVEKQVTVSSNDKLQAAATLRLRGTIWKPIEMTPVFAWLHVNPASSSNTSTVIHISNKTDQKVTLSEPQSADSRFTGALKTLEDGKEFELTVTAIPPLPPGNTASSITIKTSLTNMPVLTVPVTALSPQPVVMVTPPRITLLPAALGQKANQQIAQNVTIQASGPQALTLSDAQVNAKDVTVKVMEVIPGRRYNVMLTFPEGFKIQPGENLELSVKSNYPQYPVIKAPIGQMPAPPAVAARKE